MPLLIYQVGQATHTSCGAHSIYTAPELWPALAAQLPRARILRALFALEDDSGWATFAALQAAVRAPGSCGRGVCGVYLCGWSHTACAGRGKYVAISSLEPARSSQLLEP